MDCTTRKILGITVRRSMKVNLFLCGFRAGFPTGVANMGGAPQSLMGEGGLSQNMGGAWGGGGGGD